MVKTNSARHSKYLSFQIPQECLWTALTVKLIKYKNSLNYSRIIRGKDSETSRWGSGGLTYINVKIDALYLFIMNVRSETENWHT